MEWAGFSFVFVTPGISDLIESERGLFVSLMTERRWVEAVKFYENIRRKFPDHLPAVNALAQVAYVNRDFDTAMALLGPLVKKFPENPIWLNNLAVVLVAKGEFTVAEGLLWQAAGLSGSFLNALYNLGCLAVCRCDDHVALQFFRRVVEGSPRYERALFALSRLCKEQGLVDDAIGYCRRLVEFFPENVEYRQNLGMVLLKRGEWAEGFELYEARWQANNLPTLPMERLWDGDSSSLSGKTILLWAEQGLGDTLQFARYLPQLQMLAGHVVVAVPDLLLGLMQGSFPGVEVVSTKGMKELDYKLHAPLLSLPCLLGTTLDKIPETVPYLKIEHSVLVRWRGKIRGGVKKNRIGLVWSGNPAHRNDARRSMDLSLFQPLFEIEYFSFYSLQKGEKESDLEKLPLPFDSVRIENLAPKLDSFEDTAAVVSFLDLIISVDTSVAHLAGALACPTWLLLPFDADWRWMLERDDSPWYPTMRLFRQSRPGNWESVIDDVRHCLQALVSGEEYTP